MLPRISSVMLIEIYVIAAFIRQRKVLLLCIIDNCETICRLKTKEFQDHIGETIRVQIAKTLRNITNDYESIRS